MTPRTDALVVKLSVDTCDYPDGPVTKLIEACRQLERENRELLASLEDLLGDMSHMTPVQCLAIARKARDALAKAEGK
jgi:hypothetical protein